MDTELVLSALLKMDDMLIGILDQSPVTCGRTPAEALNETLARAQHADALGYHRYWFAEHHGAHEFFGTSPELLTVYAGTRTSTIRIGPGGILLRHQSPLRVLESFRQLTTMFPGRVDLGVARGIGADPETSQMLSAPEPGVTFGDKLAALLKLLAAPGSNVEGGSPCALARDAELWLLGSGYESARLAAHYGCRYSAAHFLAGDRTLDSIALYKDTFRASSTLASPYASVAVFAVAAATTLEARRQAAPYQLWLKLNQDGRSPFFAVPEDALSHPLSSSRQDHDHPIVGTGAEVCERILALVDRCGADECIINTICVDPCRQLDSQELLASAFGLPLRVRSL